MTPAQLNTYVNRIARTNDTTFTQADKLILANLYKDEISSAISKKHTTYFHLTALQNLVASSTLASREYAFPTAVMNNLLWLEVAFTTDTPLKYIKVPPISRYALKHALTEAQITNNFSNEAPRYLRRARFIVLLSGTVIAVTSGMRVTYVRWPSDLANMTEASTDMDTDPSSTTFGFPRRFHQLLGDRMGIHYKETNTIKLSKHDLGYEDRLETALNEINVEDNYEEMIGEVPVDEGMDY